MVEVNYSQRISNKLRRLINFRVIFSNFKFISNQNRFGEKQTSYANKCSIAAQSIIHQKISNYRPTWPQTNDVTDPGPLLGKATWQSQKTRVKIPR